MSGRLDGVISQVLANTMALGFSSAFLLITCNYTGRGAQSDGRPRISVRAVMTMEECAGSGRIPGGEGPQPELRSVSQWLNSRCQQGAELTSVVSNHV